MTETARPFNVFAADCPSREALAHVTGRWGTLVLAALTGGPLRFGALRRAVDGISERMLAQTLQALERDGLVNRDVQAVLPARVEYSLTPLGESVAGPIRALIESVHAAAPAIIAHRAATGGA